MTWPSETVSRNVRQLTPDNWGSAELQLYARISQLNNIRVHAFDRLTEAQVRLIDNLSDRLWRRIIARKFEAACLVTMATDRFVARFLEETS